jgi:hypothetical protein
LNTVTTFTSFYDSLLSGIFKSFPENNTPTDNKYGDASCVTFA